MRRTNGLAAVLALLLAGVGQAHDAVSLCSVSSDVLADSPTLSVLQRADLYDPELVTEIGRAAGVARGLASSGAYGSTTTSQILEDIDELDRLSDAASSSARRLMRDPADPIAGLDLVDTLGESTLRLGRLAGLTATRGDAARRAEAAVRRYTADKLTTLRSILRRRGVAAAAACPLAGEDRQEAVTALRKQVANADREVDRLLEALTVADGPAGIARLYEARDLTCPLACAPMAGAAEAGRWGQAAINRLRAAFSACDDVQAGANPA